MTIDARIPLGIQPVQVADPTRTLLTLASLKQAQGQQRVQDLQVRKLERDETEQQQLRDLATTYTRTDAATGQTTFDTKGYLSALNTVNPTLGLTKGLEYAKYEAARTKEQRLAEKAELEILKDRVAVVGQWAGAVLETERRAGPAAAQQHYTQVLADATQLLGADQVKGWPTTYDRRLVQRYFTQAQDVGTQLEQQWKEKQFALEQDKFAHQQQHDAAQLTVTRRGQDMQQQTALAGQQVTLRGQNLSAQTARAGHAVQREGQQLQAGQRATETEGKIRDDFTGVTKDFRSTRDAWNTLATGAQASSQAGDIAVVYGYMRLLDPGSHVLQGEQATAQNAGNIPEQVRGIYNRLLTSEGRMDAHVRQDFVQRGQQLYQRAEGDYNALSTQYKDIATRSKANPANAVPDFRTTLPQPPAATPGGQPAPQGTIKILSIEEKK